MILLIDNYDSFTFNLYQLIESLGYKTKVVLNDEITLQDVECINPDKIVISPGPRTPNYAGISVDLIQKFYKKIPILGVCLGMQCLAQVFRVQLKQANKLYHGKTDLIRHNNSILFKGIANPFRGARYHSLALESVPSNFLITAHDNTQDIMAIQHNHLPLFGVQFHPESFMTKSGKKLIGNFLNADFNN